MALLGATDGSETALHQRGAATVVRAGSAVNGMKRATKMVVFIWFYNYMFFFKLFIWCLYGFIGDFTGQNWDLIGL